MSVALPISLLVRFQTLPALPCLSEHEQYIEQIIPFAVTARVVYTLHRLLITGWT
jgi:hypothetical protein